VEGVPVVQSHQPDPKQLGKSVAEKEWLACSEAESRRTKKLEGLDLSNKKALVESKPETISIARQCELLGISRSAYYYRPVPLSRVNLQIMHAIDEIATDNAEYGYRFTPSTAPDRWPEPLGVRATV
jgi:putative transposase